jgi:hypothetical protein
LINFNFPLVRRFMVIKLLIPFFLFSVFYGYFIHFLYPERFDAAYTIQLWTSIVVLPVFALYFLNNEFKQMRSEGLSYFNSMWNYIDIIPSIGVLTTVGFSVFEIIDGTQTE